jgi:hypothetical protein
VYGDDQTKGEVERRREEKTRGEESRSRRVGAKICGGDWCRRGRKVGATLVVVEMGLCGGLQGY